MIAAGTLHAPKTVTVTATVWTGSVSVATDGLEPRAKRRRARTCAADTVFAERIALARAKQITPARRATFSGALTTAEGGATGFVSTSSACATNTSWALTALRPAARMTAVNMENVFKANATARSDTAGKTVACVYVPVWTSHARAMGDAMAPPASAFAVRDGKGACVPFPPASTVASGTRLLERVSANRATKERSATRCSALSILRRE